jgi:hypothetical protein
MKIAWKNRLFAKLANPSGGNGRVCVGRELLK